MLRSGLITSQTKNIALSHKDYQPPFCKIVDMGIYIKKHTIIREHLRLLIM